MYNYFLITLYCCELFAFVVSTRYWHKSKAHKYFSAYLLLICMVELVAKVAYELHNKGLNHFLYDYCMIPIEFIFFYGLYHTDMKASKMKQLPIVLGACYLLSWVVDVLFLEKRHFAFYSFSYTLGNFFLLILIFHYFYRLISSDLILNFKSERLFWISIGLLIFYLGSFPFYGLRNFLWAYNKQILTNYWYLITGFNCIMYLFFALSFIWDKPKSTSSLS